MPKPYTVAAYYFPNYHVDPRNEKVHGTGWTEWELVKRAEPRFPGHRQPRVPAWGYEDESDPAAMAKKINAAADHGVDAFIFDWYYYNDGPFIERPLDKTFLNAPNVSRLKFALMWANHDWIDIHPAKARTAAPLLYPGAVTSETFDRITDLVIDRYFKHPSYWKIDGKPYFSVYELFRLVQGFGGIGGTRAALDRFRAKAVAAGLPGVHMNAVLWGTSLLPGETGVKNPRELLDKLGFDSIGSYVWVHHVATPFPTADYGAIAEQSIAHWHKTISEHHLPYHPNVTVGWDASPRTVQSDRFENLGYPFMGIYEKNTPEAFRKALAAAKQFLDQNVKQGPKVCSINAWNEWTEGSYLEPDTTHGMAYLEAIRDVFGPK
ncbi:MAG: glycoside hydrolase family 99-like domain-containing protein [Planctomycetes bacterium]|nr:glycoside hydrolase family 99-like domain-containing protein [Planctomycetota bacterium]